MSRLSVDRPAASPRRPSLLRRLDYLPAWLAGGLGGLFGIVLGALSAGGLRFALPLASPLAPFVAAGVFLALLAGALALAFSGRPISVVARVSRPAPTVALRELPAGNFRMGSPSAEAGRRDNEGPVHDVRLERFACMVHPVSRRLYRKVMGETPDWPENDADEWPANRVSWYDAVEFCNRLSAQDGLQRCYDIRDGRPVRWNQAADGYRLPTEAEWEYACRAGTQTRYFFGDDAEELARHAWYSANAGGVPHAVGGREVNSWGLHDMHGNVWEWCWDWYGPYPAEAQRNPGGPETGQGRVLRGGSFVNRAEFLRSAVRDWNWPEVRVEFIGFRCVRGPRRQP